MPVLEGGKYENPFYQNVDKNTRNELEARAAFYGRRTRVGTKSSEWSYKKVGWARVVSAKYKNITLGFPGSNIMSDRDGNLTLYNSQRNVPKKPLLTGLEITNEGTMGSLLRGKFSFTVFPALTTEGFDLGNLERAFFTPGEEVEVSWGWSVAANNNKSCIQQFTGIIYNFNWQFNTDLSVTADVTIVSAATLALGQSGDQSKNATDDSGATDPKGIALKGTNLITIIDQDLATLTKANKLSKGQYKTVKSGEIDKGSKKLDYFGIVLPFQDSAVTDKDGNPVKPPADKTFWYVKLKNVVEFANKLLEDNLDFKNVYTVQVDGNEAQHNPGLKSAYPTEILFPDPEMGSYGMFETFKNSSDLDLLLGGFTGSQMPKDTINLGHILIGTDFLKKTYKEFIEDNSANIPFKNLTKFFESVTKRINESTGDMYQLSVVMYEPRESSGILNNTAGQLGKGEKNSPPKTYLSIEDTNLSKSVTDRVKPFEFEASVFRPLIKNVSISSKPPGPLAAAAYAQARSRDAEGNITNPIKPSNSDVNTAIEYEKDVPAFNNPYSEAYTQYVTDITLTGNFGFNDAWSERVRSNLVQMKKTKTSGGNGIGGANGSVGNINTPWLNNAIYPIELSITIDGIGGFKFGDVIKTNLIPRHYYLPQRDPKHPKAPGGYGMVFTITKIQHSIKDGVWETTLNTKSRISMDNTNTVGGAGGGAGGGGGGGFESQPVPPDENPT